MKNIVPIGALCRGLRCTMKPPPQSKEMKQAFNVTHANHIPNIETGARYFPIKKIDNVIELYDQTHNRDYIRFCAHTSRNFFQIYNTDVPKEIVYLIALHFAGLLDLDFLARLRTMVEAQIPEMPKEIEQRLKESTSYGKAKGS